jgi:hypothetical protein
LFEAVAAMSHRNAQHRHHHHHHHTHPPTAGPPLSSLFASLRVLSVNFSPELSPLVSTSELLGFVRVAVAEASHTLQHLEVG